MRHIHLFSSVLFVFSMSLASDLCGSSPPKGYSILKVSLVFSMFPAVMCALGGVTLTPRPFLLVRIVSESLFFRCK